jgi:hypothetical protein
MHAAGGRATPPPSAPLPPARRCSVSASTRAVVVGRPRRRTRDRRPGRQRRIRSLGRRGRRRRGLISQRPLQSSGGDLGLPDGCRRMVEIVGWLGGSPPIPSPSAQGKPSRPSAARARVAGRRALGVHQKVGGSSHPERATVSAGRRPDSDPSWSFSSSSGLVWPSDACGLAAASSRRSAYLSMSPGYRCPYRSRALLRHTSTEPRPAATPSGYLSGSRKLPKGAVGMTRPMTARP